MTCSIQYSQRDVLRLRHVPTMSVPTQASKHPFTDSCFLWYLYIVLAGHGKSRTDSDDIGCGLDMPTFHTCSWTAG